MLGALCDWQSFTLISRNVTRIRAEPINNPNHHLILPCLGEVMKAQTFVQGLVSAAGKNFVDEYRDLNQKTLKAIEAGKAQMAAAAVTKCLYDTLERSDITPFAKQNNVNQLKRTLKELSLAPPLVPDGADRGENEGGSEREEGAEGGGEEEEGREEQVGILSVDAPRCWRTS